MAEKQNKRKSALSIDFLPLIVAYIVLIAFFAIKSPHFFTVKNFLNIALYAANVGILACTMTLVIVAGHIDLSIGSVIALAGVVMGKIMQAGLPVIVAVLACLAVGMLTGVVESVLFKGVHYEMMIDTGSMRWKVHSTSMQPVGSRVGLAIVPFNIHIMRKEA